MKIQSRVVESSWSFTAGSLALQVVARAGLSVQYCTYPAFHHMIIEVYAVKFTKQRNNLQVN